VVTRRLSFICDSVTSTMPPTLKSDPEHVGAGKPSRDLFGEMPLGAPDFENTTIVYVVRPIWTTRTTELETLPAVVPRDAASSDSLSVALRASAV
jgi:hypothetical protein